MKKFAVTIGETAKGELVVVDGPSGDISGLKTGVRELVAKGGKQAGKKPAIAEAVVIHSARGIIKKQKMRAVASTPAASSD